MKNCVWRNRNLLGLSFILMVQTPFIALKLAIEDRTALTVFVEVGHVLVTSGLAAYLLSKTSKSWLERWLYGGFRRDWKEVRVMYSQTLGRGVGEGYPREPTLLIHTPENPFFLYALNEQGKGEYIALPDMNAPMMVSFNDAYVDTSHKGAATVEPGKWSELQMMQVKEVKPSGNQMTRVGFPDTRIRLSRTGQPKD